LLTLSIFLCIYESGEEEGKKKKMEGIMEKKNRKDINTYTKMKLHQNIFLLKLLN
jgi:hypothetical protein